MKKRIFIVITLVLVIVFTIKYYPAIKEVLFYNPNLLKERVLMNKSDIKIKSGNLTTDYTVEEALRDIDKFGLNTINIPIVINIDSLSSDNMDIDTFSKKKAISLMKKIDRKKVDIILEPYPWIGNGSLYETKWKPTNLNTFFYNWKTKVLDRLIKDVANPYGVEALVIASNLVEMEYATGYWCDTIDYVKKSYKGLVTYRTSWWYTATWDDKTKKDYEDKLNNILFSKLDFISIGAYFELTSNATNAVQVLTDSLYSTETYERKQNVKQEVENFYLKWKKPIFFGELGFPKRNGASIQPWNPGITNITNNLEQANCFKAYENVFENETWLMGFSIFAIGNNDKDKHYYPSNESTEILKKWYNK